MVFIVKKTKLDFYNQFLSFKTNRSVYQVGGIPHRENNYMK